MVRGKFRLDSIKQVAWNKTGVEVTFSAVTSDKDGIPEDQQYAKYTPSGSLTMFVDNPLAIDQFVLGKAYYLDLTAVE